MTYFTFDEAQQLAQGFSAPLDDSKRVLGYILDWTGGHPYLTQCLCRALLERDENWSQDGIALLVKETFLGGNVVPDSNLQEVQRMITMRADDPYATLTTYRTILRRGSVPDSAHSSPKTLLKLSGMVRTKGDRLVVRNRIYRTAFDERWVQEQLEGLPVYWPRRLQHMLQLLAVFLFLPLILTTVLAGYAWYIAVDAQTAADAQKDSAQAAALALHALARYKEDRNFSLRTLQSAVKHGWTPTVDQAMRQIMQPEPCRSLDRRLYDAAWVSKATPAVLLDPADGASPASQDLLILTETPVGGRPLLSHNGHTILVSIDADSARVWDTLTDRKVELRGTSGEVRRAVWSPDGGRIVTISEASIARVWDAASGEAQQTLTDGGIPMSSAAWSGDGQRIATAGADGIVRLWSASAAQPPTELLRQAGEVVDLAWRSDGTQIATADRQGLVRIWDVPSGTELRTLDTQAGPVLALRWSADTRYLLTVNNTVDNDVTTRVWEADSGTKVSVLQTKLTFAAAAWSPDDRQILIAGQDGTLCTYDTRERMMEDERLKKAQPLSQEEENRLIEELLPTPVPTIANPTETELPTGTPVKTPTSTESYPLPDTSTPIPTSPDGNVPAATPVPVTRTSLPSFNSTPVELPTTAPTEAPTIAPTEAPTTAPTEAPTIAPTEAPTTAPTEAPTTALTEAPTTAPTEAPTTEAPTTAPATAPTTAPIEVPADVPTVAPTADASNVVSSNRSYAVAYRQLS